MGRASPQGFIPILAGLAQTHFLSYKSHSTGPFSITRGACHAEQQAFGRWFGHPRFLCRRCGQCHRVGGADRHAPHHAPDPRRPRGWLHDLLGIDGAARSCVGTSRRGCRIDGVARRYEQNCQPFNLTCDKRANANAARPSPRQASQPQPRGLWSPRASPAPRSCARRTWRTRC